MRSVEMQHSAVVTWQQLEQQHTTWASLPSSKVTGSRHCSTRSKCGRYSNIQPTCMQQKLACRCA